MKHIQFIKAIDDFEDLTNVISKWAEKNTTSLKEFWQKCPNGDWMLWLIQQADLMPKSKDLLALWIKLIEATPEVEEKFLDDDDDEVETWMRSGEMLAAAKLYLEGKEIDAEYLEELSNEVSELAMFNENPLSGLCMDLCILCEGDSIGTEPIWGVAEQCNAVLGRKDDELYRLHADIIRKETNFFKDDKQELELYELFGVK